MEKRERREKRTWVYILSIILVAVLLIGGSLAYLTDKEDVTNRFVVGDVDVDIEEPGWKPDPDPYPDPDPNYPDKPIAPRKTWDLNSSFGEDDAVKAGDQISYRIQYYNHLAHRATVTIVDKLDTHVTYVSSSNGGTYDSTTHSVTWNMETEKYTTGKVTITVEVQETAKSAGKVVNTGTVKIEGGNEQDLGNVENPYDPDREIPPGPGGDLYPGDVKVKDPVITATRGDIYFRVKMTVSELQADGTVLDTITDTARLNLILQTLYRDQGYNTAAAVLDADSKYSLGQLTGMMSGSAPQILNVTGLNDFTLDTAYPNNAGEYYYNYTANGGLLKEGESVYFMTHVVIPTDWTATQLTILGSYAVTFQVEAIQARGFDTMAEAIAALKDELGH